MILQTAISTDKHLHILTSAATPWLSVNDRVLVVLIDGPLCDAQPEDLEIAVFAPPTQAQGLERGFDRSAHGIYELEPADPTEAARQAVLDRRAPGALVVTDGQARVLTPRPGGTAMADAVSEGLTRGVAATTGGVVGTLDCAF
jgi:hypothetical protein